MISAEIRNLVGSGSTIRKMFENGIELKKLHGADAVADMTLGNPISQPPGPMLEALADLVANPPAGLHSYTANAGLAEVRELVADNLDRRALLPGVQRQHIVLTCGASAAINIILRVVSEPGEEVVILSPYFPDYPAHVLNHRLVPIKVPSGPDFLPDLEAIARVLGPKTRAVIINHPNNPTGRQYPESLLRQLADLLRAHTAANSRPIYLISDEPYREIRFTTEPFVSPASCYEYGIMAYSYSKSMSIPGERIGYLAINPGCPAAAELESGCAIANRILGFTNAPSLWQHVIARCPGVTVDIEPLRKNRDRLLAELTAKGYQVAPPEGTFYLFPRTPGGDDQAFVTRAMENLLLLAPGNMFGSPGHFRMAFCVDERTVDLAIERLPAAC